MKTSFFYLFLFISFFVFSPVGFSQSQRPLPQPLAVVPKMEDGAPAAGKRVRQTEPEWAGTNVHHSLYLPKDFSFSPKEKKEKASPKKYPLIVEFTGNDARALGCTGEVGDAALGFTATLGKDFVWLVLPFVSKDGKRNERTWWGDVDATVRYAKLCVSRAIKKYNIAPEQVILCGFSRGAIAVSYIGLHDDEIASLWSAFFTHDHFDGQCSWGAWSGPLETYRAAAVQRLRRLKNSPNRPFWIGNMDSPQFLRVRNETHSFLRTHNLLDVARFQFETIPVRAIFNNTFPNDYIRDPHTDRWALFPSPAADRLRAWLRNAVPSSAENAENTRRHL